MCFASRNIASVLLTHSISISAHVAVQRLKLNSQIDIWSQIKSLKCYQVTCAQNDIFRSTFSDKKWNILKNYLSPSVLENDVTKKKME